jgi:hypothetical protein
MAEAEAATRTAAIASELRLRAQRQEAQLLASTGQAEMEKWTHFEAKAGSEMRDVKLALEEERARLERVALEEGSRLEREKILMREQLETERALIREQARAQAADTHRPASIQCKWVVLN